MLRPRARRADQSREARPHLRQDGADDVRPRWTSCRRRRSRSSPRCRTASRASRPRSPARSSRRSYVKLIDDVFEEFSAEPVAAASLAQVYRAVLKGRARWSRSSAAARGAEYRLQRPVRAAGAPPRCIGGWWVLAAAAAFGHWRAGGRRPHRSRCTHTHTCSRCRAAAADRLRRAVQRVAECRRCHSSSTHDHHLHHLTHLIHLHHQRRGYTELDFKNEGANMDKMRELLDAQGVRDVLIPAAPQYTSRRVFVTEGVDGAQAVGGTPDQVKDELLAGGAGRCSSPSCCTPSTVTPSLGCRRRGRGQARARSSARRPSGTR